MLEYSGRHLALIELAASLKLLLYISLIACLFVPWGLAPAEARRRRAYAIGVARLCRQARASAASLLALFETAIAKMRVFRVPEFLGAALMLGLLGDAPALRVAGPLMMHGLAFDIAHLLAGGAGAGELHAALPGPAVRAAQRLRAACVRAGAVGRLAGLCPGRAASLHHRGDRARLQGDRHPGRAAPHDRAARHPPRDRDRGRHRPDHAGRHGARGAVDGGDAARDRRAPIRWRARISPSRSPSCCSAC